MKVSWTKFWKRKKWIIKGAAGFELVTYRLVAKSQTNYATMEGNKKGVKQLYKIEQYFIFYSNRM